MIAGGMYWLRRTGGRIHHVGMKMYRREFVVRNKLDFGRHRVGEDAYFFYRSMVLAHRVAYTHFPAYIRRYRPGSLVTDETVSSLSERIRAFHQLTLTIGAVPDQASRRVIGSQQAYYTAALWILAMTRRDSAETLALIGEFQKAGFPGLMRENRHDWKLRVIYAILCLPAAFLPLQVFFARALRRIFKTRTRLF